jgi:hypothetical protein
MLGDGLTAGREAHSSFLVQDSSYDITIRLCPAVILYDGVVVDMDNINSVKY